MPAFSIRDAARSDQDEIGALIVSIQRGEYAIPITLAEQPDLAAIDTFYQVGKGGFWIAAAEDDGAVVGTIALRDIGGDAAALRKMFVHADWRGKSGVAQGLMDHLLAKARKAGLKEIFLGTTDKYLAAHRFYEKNGFERVAPEILPQSFPRIAVDTRFYRLAL